MTSWPKVLDGGTVGGEEALGVCWGFEALHAPLPLARGLVEVFRTIVEVAVLAMLHAGQDLALGRPIAR